MLYVILGRDRLGSLSKRLEVRPNHLARIDPLVQEGRILLAGPMPNVDSENPGDAGFSGSLIVAEFDSIDQARTWAEADPYMTEGVFESVEVFP
ncbi:MAG: YciI family protein, partial [Pseudomonadales bacterium]